jgi:NitT/TauT family transport system permease protein/sulfonate transport system permease protein
MSDRLLRILPGPAERDPAAHARRIRNEERLLSIATPVVFLLAWEIAGQTGLLPQRFFPPPSRIAMAAWGMARSGELQADLLASILRIAAGFVLGTVTGLAAGLLLGLSRRAHAALDPFLSALYTVPKLAILPLLLLIFGLGELPNVLLVGMTVFFLVWITSMEAVMTIPDSYREAARSFGAGRWAMFVHVIWPALLPQLFVAMRLSIGTAVLVIVGIEFVQADVGIGYRIWHSWSLFQADRMYVGICAVAVLGYLFASAVRWCARIALPWVRPRHGRDG